MTVTFVPAGTEDVERDDEDGDPDVVTFKGGEIDLSGELRDELVLAMPFNPLCDEACRGLCPLCGGNRNLVPCTHAAATPTHARAVSARWARSSSRSRSRRR